MRPLSFLLIVWACPAVAAADSAALPWTQLSLSTCGVDTFRQAHPESDGRGVVIAVLDTGVDMGVLGLTHTPSGEVKVIDVRDFTGQGDVKMRDIRYDREAGEFVYHGEDGAPQVYTCPQAGNYPPGTRFWFGILEESRFANSSVPDINDNGRTDDAFGILAAIPPGATDDEAEVYVDTDLDRDLSDEAGLRNYRVRYDHFQFVRPHKEQQITPLTCALNISLADRKVEIHFDDGGHGTHVAGIAAGFRINGQRDFHGVAPGARVISLKIGNNTLAGGATTTGSKKKAFEYAAQYARMHNVPVVCNLSYGIGSEQEGQSDIDRFLDRFCSEHPEVIVFSSAGNSGPGLSTVGTPAAGRAVITVAALLAADSARDVMGLDLNSPQVAVFSSRGGELAKPTMAVPGYASSTVPRWSVRRDFWRGTSMASPYAAGMGALMISSANQRRPDSQHRSSWIKAALQQASAPMYGYTPLDYGAGVPDMGKAVSAYENMVYELQNHVLFDFEVETDSPLAPDGKGSAAFWRTHYYPVDRAQAFTVKPRFAPTFDADAIGDFAGQYEIKSDADWLISRQQQVAFRSKQSATVRLDYDAAKLKEPGLYVGTVEGRADGQVGFRLLNTVVVPHTFSSHNDYRLKLEAQEVDGWRARRHFVAVPPGASALHLTLRARPGQLGDVAVREIFTPDGSTVDNRDFVLDTRKHINERHWTIGEELQPGVWELCITGSKPDEASHYDLEVRFSGVQARPGVIETWSHKEGRRPSGKITLTQLFEQPLPIDVRGEIEGYAVEIEEDLTPDDDVLSRKIKFNPDIRAVQIETAFSENDFARFTDVAVNLFDANGTALGKEGMNYRQTSLTVDNPDPAAEQVDCELQVQAAFADHDAEISSAARVQMTYLYRHPVALTVESPGTLYPGVAHELNFKLASAAPQNPDGTRTVGHLTIRNRGNDEAVLRVPIRR